MTNTNRHTDYRAFAEKFGLETGVSLKRYTSFRIGGPADLLALPQTREELVRLLKSAAKADIPVTLFGGGTNLLVTDAGIRGLTIITRQMRSAPEIRPDANGQTQVQCDTGQRLSTLCRFAIDNSLGGLEFAAGIPGTIGGAVAMNAGTPVGQMSDIISSLDIWDKKLQSVISVQRKDLAFSYRNLELPGIILGVTLTLKNADRQTISEVFSQTLERKKASQPVSQASAGCFFKNPPTGKPAGELIEKAGLKGLKINDAMVSPDHANYIVNLKNASSKDIIALKALIEKTVFEKFHINLETEVRVEGE